jgi:hypothetical protein
MLPVMCGGPEGQFAPSWPLVWRQIGTKSANAKIALVHSPISILHTLIHSTTPLPCCRPTSLSPLLYRSCWCCKAVNTTTSAVFRQPQLASCPIQLANSPTHSLPTNSSYSINEITVPTPKKGQWEDASEKKNNVGASEE